MKDLTNDEQKFLDQCVIATMNAILINRGSVDINDVFKHAEAMLEERRKRYEDNKEQQS